MGDGNVRANGNNKTSLFRLKMKNLPFLDYLKNLLDNMANSLVLECDKETALQYSQNSDKRKDSNIDNMSNYYTLYFVSHPFFSKLNEWYSSGKKRFPSELNLNKTILKYWYICDGNLHWRSSSQKCNVRIGCSNEMDRRDFIERILKEVGFNVSMHSHSANFSSLDTTRFFKYIGKSLPGFEYKWCYNNYKDYRRFKEYIDEIVGN